MPTFNELFKNISRRKTPSLFKIANIYLLFRSLVNVKFQHTSKSTHSKAAY